MDVQYCSNIGCTIVCDSAYLCWHRWLTIDEGAWIGGCTERMYHLVLLIIVARDGFVILHLVNIFDINRSFCYEVAI